MSPLSNAERQAQFRQRQAYERDVMKKQIAEIERWLNELQEKAGLPVRQLAKEAAPRDGGQTRATTMMIDIAALTTDHLEAYDEMMVECTPTIRQFAPLAASIWTAVLKELDSRGRVHLISGSYDNLGDALIQRTR